MTAERPTDASWDFEKQAPTRFDYDSSRKPNVEIAQVKPSLMLQGDVVLLSPRQWLEDFEQRARSVEPHDPVDVWFMAFNKDMPETLRLSQALGYAASKGARARFSICGSYNWKNPTEGVSLMPRLLPYSRRERSAQHELLLYLDDKFLSNDVGVNMSRMPKGLGHTIRFAGSNHAKGARVGDVGYFMDLNLNTDSFYGLSLALRYEDPDLLEAQSKFFQKVWDGEKISDYKVSINPGTEFIVNGQDPSLSGLNTKEKIKVLKDAKSQNVFYMNQFPPSGEMLEALAEASLERNNRVKVYIPNKNFRSFKTTPFKIAYANFAKKAGEAGVEIYHHNDPEISTHSKMLLVADIEEAQDGYKLNSSTTFMSSDNDNMVGHVSGTIETGVKLEDPRVGAEVFKWFKQVEEQSTRLVF